jgi:hypothetical protein
MHRKAIFVAIVIAAAALTVSAQLQPQIDFSPVSCFRADDMPVLTVGVDRPGTLRAFFRHVGTTDWCSVDGENRGKVSSVVLPEFKVGDDIEYYFVLLQGKVVVAKSPNLYRSSVNTACDTPINRHPLQIAMECLPRGENPVAQSIGAGLAMKATRDDHRPRESSPKCPDDRDKTDRRCRD